MRLMFFVPFSKAHATSKCMMPASFVSPAGHKNAAYRLQWRHFDARLTPVFSVILLCPCQGLSEHNTNMTGNHTDYLPLKITVYIRITKFYNLAVTKIS